MRRFAVHLCGFIAVFLGLSVLLEYLIGYKVDRGYRYYFQADWHDLKAHNSDVLFVGNSRTWVHVDPFRVQDRFNVKCEIIAQDGQGPHVVWLKFKEYVKYNKPPREIYLQFDPYFVGDIGYLLGIENFRTCFFHDRIDLTSLKDHSGFSHFYRFLPLGAINMPLLKKVILNDTLPQTLSYERTHGFQSKQKAWEGNWVRPDTTDLDRISVSPYVDSFIVCSKKLNARLYGVYSPQSHPSYMRVQPTSRIDSLFSSLARKHDYPIDFLNFNSARLYDDSTLFYNHMHLNSRGVDVFMKQLLMEERAFRSFRE